MNDSDASVDLARQVRLLAAGLGIAEDGTPPVPAEVIRLAREGQSIKAIKLLRKERKLGLLEAKRIVDAVDG
jgi:ribosomal protein L7/L12